MRVYLNETKTYSLTKLLNKWWVSGRGGNRCQPRQRCRTYTTQCFSFANYFDLQFSGPTDSTYPLIWAVIRKTNMGFVWINGQTDNWFIIKQNSFFCVVDHNSSQDNDNGMINMQGNMHVSGPIHNLLDQNNFFRAFTIGFQSCCLKIAKEK